jgi:hypothetical protein
MHPHSINCTSDAFALNIGRDDWMPARVADAYSAAQTLHLEFKLFISFDMACVLNTSRSSELNGLQVSRVHIAERHLLATGVYYPLCRPPKPVHL